MTSSLELSPLHALHDALSKMFGPEWWRLEDETLSLELGLEFSNLFLSKIRLLKGLLSDARGTDHILADDEVSGVMCHDELRVSSDPLVFMVANDVINNRDPDPSLAILPAPHEMHYTVTQLGMLPINFAPGDMLRLLADEVCHSHGIIAPIFPFQREDEFPHRLTPEAVAQAQAFRKVLNLYHADQAGAFQ